MPLPTAAERLRAAVISGDYWGVDQLLDTYRGEVETAWKQAKSAEDRQRIATDVTSLLQWARHSILAARSHTQRRRVLLSRQRSYAASGKGSADQLELNA